MKLTEWYSGNQKPVRAGVYERLSQRSGFECLFYSYWNGKYFCEDYHSIFTAHLHRYSCGSENQNLPWRGVAK